VLTAAPTGSTAKCMDFGDVVALMDARAGKSQTGRRRHKKAQISNWNPAFAHVHLGRPWGV